MAKKLIKNFKILLSLKIHKSSKMRRTGKMLKIINKLTIKIKAFKKEFYKNSRYMINNYYLTKKKKIYLLEENSINELSNHLLMTIENELNNIYAYKKENIIKNEYKRFIIEKPVKNNRVPKVEAKFYNPKINELKNKALNLSNNVIKK